MYTFVTDAGHGWLQVPLTEFINSLKHGKGYSSCSYANPKTGFVYLEEDLDASTFIQYLKDRGEEFKFTEVSHGNTSWVRNLPNLKDTRA